MDVLLVSPLPPPYGGISHWTRLVVDYAEQRSDGLSIRVLDTSPRSRPGLKVSLWRRLAEGVGRMVRDSARLINELARRRPAVVHLNTSGHLAFYRDLVMTTLANAFKVPVVYHLRFGRLADIAALDNWEWRVARRAIRRASSVIALDPRTEQCLIDRTGARNVVRVPNPIPPDRFPAEPNGTKRRNVVLYVGWVVPTKGIEDLMAAWGALDADGWCLEIVGPGDASYLAHLRDGGLPSGVVMVGSLDNADVLSRMQTSSIFVFPSHTEGFPNAVAEAMAAGLAIVASDVGAIGDMLSGSAGVVVAPRAVARLSEAMDRLMRSAKAREEMGKIARAKALAEYSLASVFDDYVEIWELVAPSRA